MLALVIAPKICLDDVLCSTSIASRKGQVERSHGNIKTWRVRCGVTKCVSSAFADAPLLNDESRVKEIREVLIDSRLDFFSCHEARPRFGTFHALSLMIPLSSLGMVQILMLDTLVSDFAKALKAVDTDRPISH